MNKILFLALSVFYTAYSFAHNVDYDRIVLKEWNVNGESFKGSFLMSRNDSVFIEKSNSEIVAFKLSLFNKEDKTYLKSRMKTVADLNDQIVPPTKTDGNSNEWIKTPVIVVLSLLLVIGLFAFSSRYKANRKYLMPIMGIGVITFLSSSTDPNEIQQAFLPFAPDVNTFWDNDYLYVESKGIPSSHTMMVGISDQGWQQQVPVPQCYIGSNSWSIPLNPIMASTPTPVDQSHFTKGAIAIAVNGVPIFNPYTNTGEDAYLAGQLDSYGGHSGRGDDYHYHIAPLHLYNQTVSTLPIAYAFDGFAVYGSLEPDGSSMTTLDANHGHVFNGVYHYHGTNSAPYMIAKFAGEVTEDADHQLIPQAQSSPVRTENWTPLSGALITSCVPNGSGNGYNLSYTLNNVSGYATNYSWTGSTYTYNYVTPSGATLTNYNGFVQCTVVGISENNYNVFTVYPNPFVDKINVLNADSNDYYTLCNSFGNTVYVGKNIGMQNFSYMPAGVYFLKSKNQVYKLIKR